MSFGQEVSSAGVNRFYIGSGMSGIFGAMAGMTFGRSDGPGASLAASVPSVSLGGAKVFSRLHLMGSQLRSEVEGPVSRPTPGAWDKTTRVIPSFESEVVFRPDLKVKATAYYDYSKYQYSDSARSESARHLTHQFGGQGVLQAGAWQVGLSGKQIDFSLNNEFSKQETQGAVELSRGFELGSQTWLEPRLQAQAVSEYGVLPGGGLGIRFGDRQALFARFDYSERVPTLMDRYYSAPFFVPNPGLRPEQNFTSQLGFEWKGPTVDHSILGYHQLRRDLFVWTTQSGGSSQTQNLGTGQVLGLVHQLNIRVMSFLDFNHAATLAYSKLEMTGEPFPYLPRFSEVVGFNLHTWEERPLWVFGTQLRAQSPMAYNEKGTTLGGFGLLDMRLSKNKLLSLTPSQAIDLHLAVDNVLDRRVETVKDFPLSGRVFRVALAGQF